MPVDKCELEPAGNFYALSDPPVPQMLDHDKLILCVNAMRDVIGWRDYCADNGDYPEGLLDADQCFDDKAADFLEECLHLIGEKAPWEDIAD